MNAGGGVPRTPHVTLKAHRGPIHVARYAKGSAKYVLTAGQDRTVRLWNAGTGAEIKTYAAHGYEVLGLAVAHDNAKFASGGGDRSVFIWDVTTGNTLRRLSGHLSRVNAIEFNSDATVVASGSFDATVRLWDLKSQSRTPIQTLDESKDAVQAIVVSGAQIISGSVDGHVRTYDLRMGELRSDYMGNPVVGLALSADGQTLLVTTLDSTIRLMDMSTGKMLNSFTGHSNNDYRCRACFGHNEATVVCGDEDGAVWAWDLLEVRARRAINRMQFLICSIGQPARTKSSTESGYGPLRGISLLIQHSQVHNKMITWTEYHPTESSELLTASGDGTAVIWRAQCELTDKATLTIKLMPHRM
ncbi:WD40-repeat-containing domain protein [Schizophyllum fasciatum]